ncbi:MAG: class I SAM-dependent methyltransferase [Gammaproteobacteria bacterium]|nr:class I SAM-dependent methyltransferase [Gammaproteobacteria bacterium]
MEPPRPTLRLAASDFHILLERLGPSLTLWRAAEIAARRLQTYERPILDLGCGDGIVTSFVLPRVDIGVDPSAHAITCATALSMYDRLKQQRLEDATIPAASVGTILSNSVLEHLPNVGLTLTAAHRLLRPGGRLIFTAPTEAFSNWLALPLPAYRQWRNHHYEHRNLWPLDRWVFELTRAGFRITSVQPYLRRKLVTAWDALGPVIN